NGHRCNERRFLEFHHVDPHALGGEASVDKIELRCRRHNDYEGRLYFGERRRDATGAVREKAISYGPPPLERADLFRNKLAGGPAPSPPSAGVELQG
ncbi:MAG TPA: HNH endonuclease, partial [Vicinamibacteria bacterium]|nr:HNH endonuclease [Vicinamibacteria bacterium]